MVVSSSGYMIYRPHKTRRAGGVVCCGSMRANLVITSSVDTKPQRTNSPCTMHPCAHLQWLGPVSHFSEVVEKVEVVFAHFTCLHQQRKRSVIHVLAVSVSSSARCGWWMPSLGQCTQPLTPSPLRTCSFPLQMYCNPSRLPERSGSSPYLLTVSQSAEDPNVFVPLSHVSELV